MRRICAIGGLVVYVTGCKFGNSPTAPQETSITEKVEAAAIYPSELKRADAAGLQLWLSQHTEVAHSIASQCKAAMKEDISWKMSDEGRICLREKYAGF